MYTATPKMKAYASQQLLHTLQQKPLQQPMFCELSPSTPQKLNVVKNLKVLNAPSQPTDGSFRQSNGKRVLTQESPMVNKENFRLGSECSQIEIQLKHVTQENKKLSELVQRLFKEKQELVIQVADFAQLKQRVERMELVIDTQSNEIEEWKAKYQEVCESDQRIVMIDQMEQQIQPVIEENERLNEVHAQMTVKVTALEKQIKELEYKVADQNNQIIAYEEEKLNQSQRKSIPKIDCGQKLSEYINSLEQHISEASSQYTSQVLENQKLNRMNISLKEELASLHRQYEEGRGTSKAVNPRFQEMKQILVQLREKITQQIQ